MDQSKKYRQTTNKTPNPDKTTLSVFGDWLGIGALLNAWPFHLKLLPSSPCLIVWRLKVSHRWTFMAFCLFWACVQPWMWAWTSRFPETGDSFSKSLFPKASPSLAFPSKLSGYCFPQLLFFPAFSLFLSFFFFEDNVDSLPRES